MGPDMRSCMSDTKYRPRTGGWAVGFWKQRAAPLDCPVRDFKVHADWHSFQSACWAPAGALPNARMTESSHDAVRIRPAQSAAGGRRGRLMDKDMYTAMDMASDSPLVARGIALHKMVSAACPSRKRSDPRAASQDRNPCCQSRPIPGLPVKTDPRAARQGPEACLKGRRPHQAQRCRERGAGARAAW